MDNLGLVWDKFFRERIKPLAERFPGWYRAIVKETNDPLNIGRIRFMCPDLHDSDLSVDMLPWAVPAPGFGGKGSGEWDNVIIGDVVYITWEKNHPYAPIWVSGADPTRRAFYPLESIYSKTPIPVDTKGEQTEPLDDFNQDYLPKDGRPMQHGSRDRYGNLELASSVGFFPIEHDKKPEDPGYDALTSREFDVAQRKPEENNPDLKFMVRMTKYGNFMILSDVGYLWKKDGENGEFVGDFEEDHEFEIDRWKYLQRLLNEDEPTDTDQRRLEARTRYGHKFEMRDVGWGGQNGKTREDEFGDPRIVSNGDKDQRWLKLRTKGGMLIQSIDIGFDPQDDEFIKRKLIDEVGTMADGEDDWDGRDARMIRCATRHGFKIVLDDRGSDTKDAEGKEEPHGNGLLIKGRRSNRGFGIEFNEKDEVNAFRAYSPEGKILELNDKNGYVILCTNPVDGENLISEEWQKLAENEFALNQARTFNPELDTFHLLLDAENEYFRLKSPKLAGIEVRDNDFVWTEMRDSEDRGIWFSETDGYAVWRAKEGRRLFILVDDDEPAIAIQNDDQGRIQIFCQEKVEVVANGDIDMAGKNINMVAENRICMRAAGSDFVVQAGKVGTNVEFNAPVSNAFHTGCFPGGGAGPSSPLSCGALAKPEKIEKDRLRPESEPDERGATGDQDYSAIDQSIITG